MLAPEAEKWQWGSVSWSSSISMPVLLLLSLFVAYTFFSIVPDIPLPIVSSTSAAVFGFIFSSRQ